MLAAAGKTLAHRGDPAVGALAAPLKREYCIVGGAVTSIGLEQSAQMDEKRERREAAGPSERSGTSLGLRSARRASLVGRTIWIDGELARGHSHGRS